MIKRDTYKEITSGGSGSWATQDEIFEIFQGTNPEGKARSLFANSGETGIFSLTEYLLKIWLQQSTSARQDTQTNVLDMIRTYISPNSTNGSTIADQLSETISGGDQTIANLLVDSVVGSNQSAANLLFEISNALNSQRTPKAIETSTSGTLNVQIHNISIANTGSATGTITIDGNTINLPSGVSVDYNAGGLNNRFAVNKFGYDATGTTFIITYVQ